MTLQIKHFYPPFILFVLVVCAAWYYDPYIHWYSYDNFIVANESDHLRMWLFQVSWNPVQFYLMICGLMVII